MAVRTVRRTRYNVPMQKRGLVVLAALAGAVLVLLPLGGGAIAATSIGANGDVAYVQGGTHLSVVSGDTDLARRRGRRSVLVAGRDEARVLVDGNPGPITVCVVATCSGTRDGSRRDTGT